MMFDEAVIRALVNVSVYVLLVAVVKDSEVTMPACLLSVAAPLAAVVVPLSRISLNPAPIVWFAENV